MLTQKVVQHMLSECPHCHGQLRFGIWQPSTVCHHCGTYFWLHPRIQNNLKVVMVPAPVFEENQNPL